MNNNGKWGDGSTYRDSFELAQRGSFYTLSFANNIQDDIDILHTL